MPRLMRSKAVGTLLAGVSLSWQTAFAADEAAYARWVERAKRPPTLLFTAETRDAAKARIAGDVDGRVCLFRVAPDGSALSLSR